MNIEELICMSIAKAGESRSLSVNAIEMAKVGNYDEAEKLLKEANNSYFEAHREHKKLLDISNGLHEKLEITYLIVHMLDIITIAEIMLEMAKNTIYTIQNSK